MTHAPSPPLRTPLPPPGRYSRHAVAEAATLGRRVGALSIVELQRLRHDPTEIFTRAIQPALWLVVFGQTFTHLHVIPTGSLAYVDFLAPGVLAQSALFVAIFYGIQIIWEKDAGVLARLLVTPTSRAALITGKAFAAGVRALGQAIVVVVVASLLGVPFQMNPLHLLGALAALILGTGFFACLSMAVAGIVISRDRLMSVTQAIAMPLFFCSNSLYPVNLMPGWLQALSTVNPLTYEVEALRGMLLGTPANLMTDFAVLFVSLILGILGAASLLQRLIR